MLDVRLFRIMADNTHDVETRRNTYFDIEVDLSTDCAEGEHNAETAPRELLDLIDRYEMRS